MKSGYMSEAIKITKAGRSTATQWQCLLLYVKMKLAFKSQQEITERTYEYDLLSLK